MTARLAIVLACAWALSPVGLLPSAAAAAERLETYELDHLDPDAVIEAIGPLLGPEARVSRLGDAVLLVAEERDHERVDALLLRLDRPPPEYRIRVLQGVSRMRARALATPGAALHAANETRPSELRVTAGRPARIESGRTVRVWESVFAGLFGFGATRVDRPSVRGFQVEARPRGRRVELRIAPLRVDPGPPERGDLRGQEMGSYLIVTPGRWVQIGSGQPTRAAGARSYDTEPGTEDGAVLVRVDEIPPARR